MKRLFLLLTAIVCTYASLAQNNVYGKKVVGLDSLVSDTIRARTTGAVTVGNNLDVVGTTSTNSLETKNGSSNVLFGADNGTDGSITDATQKITRIGVPHYTNSEEPWALMLGVSNAETNALSIGGFENSMNAASSIGFFTAANNTTIVGSRAMIIEDDQSVIFEDVIKVRGSISDDGGDLELADILDFTSYGSGTHTGTRPLYYLGVDGSGNVLEVDSADVVVDTPAGSNTEIQFNDNGVFGASEDFTYNSASGLSIGVSTSTLALLGDKLSLTALAPRFELIETDNADDNFYTRMQSGVITIGSKTDLNVFTDYIRMDMNDITNKTVEFLGDVDFNANDLTDIGSLTVANGDFFADGDSVIINNLKFRGSSIESSNNTLFIESLDILDMREEVTAGEKYFTLGESSSYFRLGSKGIDYNEDGNYAYWRTGGANDTTYQLTIEGSDFSISNAPLKVTTFQNNSGTDVGSNRLYLQRFYNGSTLLQTWEDDGSIDFESNTLTDIGTTDTDSLYVSGNSDLVGTLDVTGNATFSGNVIASGGDIYLGASSPALTISGGSNASSGGQIQLNGEGASAASDIIFKADEVEVGRWDESASEWKFGGNDLTNINNATFSGDLTIGATKTGSATILEINGADGENSRLFFDEDGVTKWNIGHQESDASFNIFNSVLGVNAFRVDSATNDISMTSDVSIAGDVTIEGKTSIGDGSELTIATGAITITTGFHEVDTEGDAATDDLETINGGIDGQIIVINARNTARTVVVKDNTGNLRLAGDFSMDNRQDRIMLIYDSGTATWNEVSRSDNGG